MMVKDECFGEKKKKSCECLKSGAHVIRVGDWKCRKANRECFDCIMTEYVRWSSQSGSEKLAGKQ